MKSKVYLFLKNNIPDNLKQYIYPILNFKKKFNNQITLVDNKKFEDKYLWTR